MKHTWSRDTSVTKLSGPARDGSNTSVFAPLTYEIDDGHMVLRDEKQLTELSACTREFLAISRSKDTSTVSRRWSELRAVEVVIFGHLSGPPHAYDNRFIYSIVHTFVI